jgi:hypothetical protein
MRKVKFERQGGRNPAAEAQARMKQARECSPSLFEAERAMREKQAQEGNELAFLRAFHREVTESDPKWKARAEALEIQLEFFRFCEKTERENEEKLGSTPTPLP